MGKQRIELLVSINTHKGTLFIVLGGGGVTSPSLVVLLNSALDGEARTDPDKPKAMIE